LKGFLAFLDNIWEFNIFLLLEGEAVYRKEIFPTPMRVLKTKGPPEESRRLLLKTFSIS